MVIIDLPEWIIIADTVNDIVKWMLYKYREDNPGKLPPELVSPVGLVLYRLVLRGAVDAMRSGRAVDVYQAVREALKALNEDVVRKAAREACGGEACVEKVVELVRDVASHYLGLSSSRA